MGRVVAIVGPTAVGKTALSVEVAAAIDGEVVNVDSRQVYRGMDIGTGKPATSIRARVPHHLFDLVDPDAEFSLAQYLDEARASIETIHRRDATAVLVGGTGQYFWALVEGWTVPRVPPNPALRDRLHNEAREGGPMALHRRLAETDPASALSIDPNNVRRTIRALEVIEATGRPFSAQRRALPPEWDVTIVGLRLDRDVLSDRITTRIADQMDAGWADEVRGLLGRGYCVDLPSFRSLGYREVARLVAGEQTRDETIRQNVVATRRFARRQYRWFRLTDDRISWIDVGETAQPLEGALSLVG